MMSLLENEAAYSSSLRHNTHQSKGQELHRMCLMTDKSTHDTWSYIYFSLVFFSRRKNMQTK